MQSPVQVARKFGALGLDFEFGPVLRSVGRSEWLYGIVGGVEVTRTTELMAELHGTARTSFARDVLTVNAGLRQNLVAHRRARVAIDAERRGDVDIACR